LGILTISIALPLTSRPGRHSPHDPCRARRCRIPWSHSDAGTQPSGAGLLLCDSARAKRKRRTAGLRRGTHLLLSDRPGPIAGPGPSSEPDLHLSMHPAQASDEGLLAIVPNDLMPEGSRSSAGPLTSAGWPGVQFVRWLRAVRHRRVRRSPDHVSALSRPGTRPGIRPVIQDDRLEGAILMSWFPAAFPLPALASWSSCSRRGVGLSSRSAYRSHRPDLDGVSTFRTHKTRPERAPSIARGRWCSSRPTTIIGLRPPHHSGMSLNPATTSITAELRLTSHQRGFKQFARPVFPSPADPWMDQGRLRLSPELRTPPLRATHVGAGTDRLSTDPKPALRHQPDLQPRGFTCGVRPRVALVEAAVPSGCRLGAGRAQFRQ